MNETLHEIRLRRSSEFNAFCDAILAHDGQFPKPIGVELSRYRRLFTAVLNDDDLRDRAADDLRRLTVIELYIEQRNAEQA